MDFLIRKMTKDDTEECLRLFSLTIQYINSRDYSPIQVEAWINPKRSYQEWQDSFENRDAYVICDSLKIVGFADMDETGYLDRLYVHHQYQNRGIGKMLVKTLETIAREKQIKIMETHASITAKPFFEHLSYQVVHRQTVNCRGVLMDNFVMKKKLL